MVSCNMCRNGYTALGNPCANGCEQTPTQTVLDTLQRVSEISEPKLQPIFRDAIGEIVRLQRACGER